MKMNRPFDMGSRVQSSQISVGVMQTGAGITGEDGVGATPFPVFSWTMLESLPAKAANLPGGSKAPFHILDFDLLK